MKTISFVIPVFNEENNVANLHHEIKAVAERENYTYEIIFVDDGSSDRTVEILKTLSPITIIQFRRNFGQTAAIDAGVHKAKYHYIATMDGDGQNDPADIPKMIAMLESQNLDIVSGWRKDRKDSFMKHFVSRGANILRTFFIHDGIHDSGCSLKIYKHQCFDGLSLYGEMHRFIPGLLKIRGFTIGEMVVNHRPRTAGITKYNWKRTLKGFVDMVSVWFWGKFAVRPLHLLGGIGIVLIMLSIPTGIKTTYDYFRGKEMSDSAWPLLTMFFFLSGIQTFISGLLADILVKSYFEAAKKKHYHIKEIVEKE